MTQQVAKARITLTQDVSLTDICHIDLVAEATGSDTGLDFGSALSPQDAIAEFFNTNFGTQPVNFYLSSAVTRTANAIQIDWTDITAHLDGSPAGPPFRTDFITISTEGGIDKMPPQLAVCCGYRRAYGGDIERGVTASVPTPDRAVDLGAPSTHSGQIRPRSRDRGRFYLGPMATHSLDATTGNLLSTARADILAALQDLFATQNSGGANQFRFVQWSRANASVGPAGFVFVDEGFATQRRRQDVTVARVHAWSAAGS